MVMRIFINLILSVILLLFGDIIMLKEVESEVAATSRHSLTSDELTNVIAIYGTAKLLEEKTVSISGVTPNLYQRRFELAELEIIRGNATALENMTSITFSGFTTLSLAQRTLDSRSPILWLEGQDFFDSKLPPDLMNVLLLIGEPEIVPTPELLVRGALVESAIYRNQPVRAFLLKGANITLPQAMLSLVGWQPGPTLATARAATIAAHPLIALDALRIATRIGACDQVELLAQWLLHPVQPVGVKAIAIQLLGEAINQMPKGSKEADSLIAVAVAGWEAERAYQTDTAYLRALQSASEHIKSSNQLNRVEAIADDYHIRELIILSKQLSKSLKK